MEGSHEGEGERGRAARRALLALLARPITSASRGSGPPSAAPQSATRDQCPAAATTSTLAPRDNSPARCLVALNCRASRGAARAHLGGQIFIRAVAGVQAEDVGGRGIPAQQQAPGVGITHAALRVVVARLRGQAAGGPRRAASPTPCPKPCRNRANRARAEGGRAHLERLQSGQRPIAKAPPPQVVLCAG
jgi:hypothetical protein